MPRTAATLTVAPFTPAVPLIRFGHRELRNDLASVLEKIREAHGAIEVVNRGRSEAVVVAHDVFADLVASRRELDELRGTVGLLMSAVAAGAAVPSETLTRLGIDLPVDFDALQNFQARYPARVTRDETGHPLAPVPAIPPNTYLGELDEPDEFLDVDE